MERIIRKLNTPFFKYAMIGAIATLLDWAVFYILNSLFGVFYQIAVSVSFFVGGTTKFIFNKFITFRNKSRQIHLQYLVFLIVSLIGIYFSIVFMAVFVEFFKLDEFLSRIITTFIILFINYFLDKMITFNKRFFRR